MPYILYNTKTGKRLTNNPYPAPYRVDGKEPVLADGIVELEYVVGSVAPPAGKTLSSAVETIDLDAKKLIRTYTFVDFVESPAAKAARFRAIMRDEYMKLPAAVRTAFAPIYNDVVPFMDLGDWEVAEALVQNASIPPNSPELDEAKAHFLQLISAAKP
jgi:hypothetical protein